MSALPVSDLPVSDPLVPARPRPDPDGKAPGHTALDRTNLDGTNQARTNQDGATPGDAAPGRTGADYAPPDRPPPDPAAPDGPPARPHLVAVVVTCNRLEQLQVTLARYLSHPPGVLGGVVVLDNASSDGTRDWLAGQSDPRLHVISNDTNTGGAGGFSRAITAAATQFDPDWMVISDDDARPVPGALQAFVAADPGARWQACAAAVRAPGGAICAMNRPAMNPFRDARAFWRTLRGGGRRGFHLPDAAFAPDAPECAVHASSFVGFFLSRAGLARAGLPEAGLFLYGDDTLYTIGLTEAGGRLGFLPQVGFEHDFRSFGAGAHERLTPAWRVYYYHRNLLFLYRRCAGIWFVPVLAVVLPKWLLKAKSYPGARGQFLRLLGLAIRDGLSNRRFRPHEDILAFAEARTDAGTAPAAAKPPPRPEGIAGG